MNKRAILFSGGFSHPFEESSAALAHIAEQQGWAVQIETDLGKALDALQNADLLMVNALYWSMTQHEKYAPHRAEWAYELPGARMDAMQHFVEKGGALLALHTATICFDTEPRWKALLGGGWTWGHSHHPPYNEITVTPKGAVPFVIDDENYHNLDPVSDTTILATCDTGEGPQPLVWYRGVGQGRVGVDALGHDAASIHAPGHQALLTQLLAFLG